MPTYYDCGALHDSEPLDRDTFLPYRCEDCDECRGPEYDDDDGYGTPIDSGAARRAADYALSLPSSALHDMTVGVRRQVSCEWEATRGVTTAYQACANVGAPCDHHGDCTCDGELVFPRLELWRPSVAESYARSLATLDYLRHESIVAVGFAAGHHIHASARNESGRGLSPNNLVSLYSVFAHCEDLLYRFAAAGWSRHRSEEGGGYSEPMLKLPAGQARTAKNVGSRIANERYQGLNVSPYVQAISNCRCGAYRFGEWESCECPDHGHTVEWRLWNAAISPRKIRTYCAITAAVTDYAANVDTRDVVGLGENPFRGTGSVDEESLYSQLEYLVSIPMFDKRDRDDIQWLASISPGMGEIGTDYVSSRGAMLAYTLDPSATV